MHTQIKEKGTPGKKAVAKQDKCIDKQNDLIFAESEE